MSYKGIKFNGEVLEIPQEYLKNIDITDGVLTIIDSTGKTYTFTIPEGVATEDFVRQQISGLVNEEALNNALEEKANKSDLETTNSNLTGLSSSISILEDIKANKTEIPSLAGYATETFVKNEIANAQLGGEGGDIDLSGYATKDELDLKADKTQLADYVTNEALNNKGYLTSVPEEYKTKAENDAIYQKKGDYLTQELDPSVPDWAKQPSKPKYKYSEIDETPTIPTALKDLSQDSDNRTVSDADIEAWNNKSEFDGDYNSLTNKPEIPSVDGLATESYVNNAVADKATTSYVDGKIDAIVGEGASETLDTIGEISKAIEENESVVDALNDAIGSKANQTDLDITNSNVSNLTTRVANLDSNKADKTELFSGSYNDLKNKPTIPTSLSQLTQTDSYRTVTDLEKSTWNNKSNFSGDYSDLKNKPEIPSKTSQITNDSGFISEEELTGYVSKSDDLYVSNIQEVVQSNSDGFIFTTSKPYVSGYSNLLLGFSTLDFEKSVTVGGNQRTHTVKLKDVVKTNNIIDLVYPIGSIYLTTSSDSIGPTSPASWLGGNWERLPEGYALWTASSGAGNTISAGIPNLTGSIDLQNHNGNNVVSTSNTALSFEKGETRPTAIGQTSNNKASTIISLDANKQNSVYRDDITTVQPPAFKVYAWRRVP